MSLVCSAQMKQIIIVVSTLKDEDILRTSGPLYQADHLVKFV